MNKKTYISALNYLSLFFTLSMTVIMMASVVYSYFWIANMFKDFSLDVANNRIFFALGVGCFVTATSVLIIGSSLGEWWNRFYFNMRKPTLREQDRINVIIDDIKAQYKDAYGEVINIKYFIVDANFMNGFAFGFETIAIHRGALEELDDDELSALIAHEIGHIHHQDGAYRLVAISLSACMKPFIFFTDVWMLHGALILISLLFLWPIFAAFILLSIPLAIRNKIDGLADWPKEYRADSFAANLGYGDGIISFFEKLQPLDERNRHGFMSRYGYSHPPTAMRIDKVERLLAV